MVIQTFGPVVRLADSAVRHGAGWYEHRENPRTASLPITVQFQTAIYANLVHLGIGVPFYM
ncbi:MAG TPA: hypothetical protein DCQ30_10500 [Acidimicrobiaceae bacterium]|nr:hypothetical protein [Acidimicrobiaceae bacterium]